MCITIFQSRRLSDLWALHLGICEFSRAIILEVLFRIVMLYVTGSSLCNGPFLDNYDSPDTLFCMEFVLMMMMKEVLATARWLWLQNRTR